MSAGAAPCSSLIEDFLAGRDTALTTANRIEVMLEEAFPDDDFIQEVVIALAMYRPGGHAHTVDEMTIRALLVRTQRYLASL